MTGHTTEILYFNQWINENYNGLKKYCRRYNIDEDYLNDAFLKVHERILKSGYTTCQFMTYIKTTINNLKINEHKKQNGKFYVEIKDDDYINTIEEKLIEIENDELQVQIYRDELLQFSKMLFKFIMNEKKYDEEWQFVFRCYYIMPGRITYNKLTEMTGFNKNKCTLIIQTMKKDIRKEFITWMRNEQRRDYRNNE
jgi:hypothetical protein